MAHKPGVMAIRPLRLGDVFDAAINTVRRNPGATLGLTAVVASVLVLTPWALASLVSFAPSLFGLGPLTSEEATVIGTVGLFAGVVSVSIGSIITTGLIAPVAKAAAIGHKLGIGQAWRATHGVRWRILGLSLVQSIALVFAVLLFIGITAVTVQVLGDLGWFILIPVIPGTLFAVAFLYVKWSLALPALVLERVGVVGALRRSWGLTKRQWWRVFGILLLATLAIGVVSQIFSVPGSILALLPPLFIDDVALATNLSGLITLISVVLSQVVTVPFTASTSVFLYLDQRIRKEGYDIVLWEESEGIRQAALAPTPQPGPGR